MSFLPRRRFLKSVAATSATLAAGSLATRSLAARTLFAQTAPAAPAGKLTLHPDRSGPTVPASFIGLSYETEELTRPATFSRENTGLIAKFRQLSPTGVLRIGGNTSDVGWWKPTAASIQPPMPHFAAEVGEPSTDLSYPVTPEAVRALRGFLDATGWSCIYGLNLGTETPARSAEQAAFVAATLGPKLDYFQIGNEPDGLAPHLRDKATWNASRYFDEWIVIANAVRARVPDARFGLPDAASNITWLRTVTDRLTALPNPPHVAALTHHYYFGGPPSSPDVTIARLLAPDPRVPRDAAAVREAAARLHVPYRMTEGNTCYRGGKPGVSDVFAAALWAADYALNLASLGYAGLNLHGGDGGKFVGNSLGGHLPGEDLLKPGDPAQPRPFYTPVAHLNGAYVAEPTFYGLQFAAAFAGATMIPLTFDPGGVDATAYAARLPTGQQIVAILNKDDHQALPLDLPGFSVSQQLTAPSLLAYSAQLNEPQSNREASAVPAGSALLLLSARSA